MTVAEVTNSNLVSNIKDAVQKKFVDKDAANFADILKNNFSAIDANRDNVLSSNEIQNSLSHLKLDNISELITKIDLNSDGAITIPELDTKNGISKVVSSTIKDVLSDKSSSEILSNAVGKISKACHLNDFAQKTITSALGKLV